MMLLKSRKSELRYLQNVCEGLLRYICIAKQLNCRSAVHLFQEVLAGSILLPAIDAMADPDFVNHFLVLLFDKSTVMQQPQRVSSQVPLLQHFVSTSGWRNSLSLPLSNLENQPYLFPLMSFLKEDNAVNILQFCLTVDDFNQRLLNPEMSPEDALKLQEEAWKLYNDYLAPSAVDKIDFSEDVVTQFKEIISGPPASITRLQNTEPLYLLHEYAFNQLEMVYLPLFYQSEAYFEYTCGSRDKLIDSALNNRKKPEMSAAARLSQKLNKLRGVFKAAATIDGRLEGDMNSLSDAAFEADEKFGEDIDSAYGEMDDISLRDLSAWRVCIPRVEARQDCNEKQYHVFIIDVQRIDVSDKENPDELHWVVERQHQEFYVLEAKLAEFHGDLVDIRLPSRRTIFSSKGYEYMESKRAAFEEFLQRLLQKPVFRGSQLLFNFLSSTGDFTEGFLPDLNLGKMIKTVPMKLVKERGQHLEVFLQNFLLSVETVKNRGKADVKEGSSTETSAIQLRLSHSLFGDLAGRKVSAVCFDPNDEQKLPAVPVESVTDYLVYLGIRVFHTPCLVLRFILAVVRATGSFLQQAFDSYLTSQLLLLLNPMTLADFISLLRVTVFPEGQNEPHSTEGQQKRAEMALSKMKAFLPTFFLGGKQHSIEGWTKLHYIFQSPRLNKQLMYVLLEIVILELFPELQSEKEN